MREYAQVAMDAFTLKNALSLTCQREFESGLKSRSDRRNS